MKARSALLLAALAAATFGVAPSVATSHCSFEGGSKDDPQIVDALGDGLLEQTDPLVEEQDTTDLVAAWFARAEDGTPEVHVQMRNLTGAETNQIVYVNWEYNDPDAPHKRKRFVSAQPRPVVGANGTVVYEGAYRFGYLDETTPGVSTFTSEGWTDGYTVAGAGGEIVISVPLDKMGDPQTGEVLENLNVESRVLIGPPGHGQKGIYPGHGVSGVPGSGPDYGASGFGLVSVIDDTSNLIDGCDFISV